MGRLAVQVGEQLDRFFPANWEQGMPSRVALRPAKAKLDKQLLSDRSERTVAAKVLGEPCAEVKGRQNK
jgi:hypothetical protein